MEKSIGIYIAERDVIAACMTHTKGILKLERYAIEPFSTEEIQEAPEIPTEEIPSETKKPDFVSADLAIQRTLEKIGAKRGRVFASFSPFHLATRFFKMPVIPRKEWEEAVQLEARRFVPYKIEESISDYRIEFRDAVPDGKMLWVTFTAVKRSVLQNYLEYLRNGSARVQMIEPSYCSMTRALSVVEKTLSDKTYGMVLIDSNGSVNVTLCSKGIVYLSRDFLLTEDQVANETRFYQEIKASFDFLYQKSGERVIDQVFIGGNGELIFWSNFLTSVFGKEITFTLATFPTEQNIPKNVLSALIVPIGLALRGLKIVSPLSDLSLLPEEERQLDPEVIKRTVGIEFIIIALLFFLLRLLVLNPYLGSVKTDAVQQLSPEARVDSKLVREDLPALQKMKKDLQSELAEFKEITLKESSLYEMLRTISTTLSQALWLEEIDYRLSGAGRRSDFIRSQQTQSMVLTLKGASYLNNADLEVREINAWLEKLRKQSAFSSRFSSVTLQQVRRQMKKDRPVTMFEVVCQ